MTQKTGWTPETQDRDDAQSAAPSPGQDDSTLTVLLRLIEEGRAYAQTEAERQRLRANLIARAGLVAALLFAVALFLLMGALVSLLIGLIWALAPHTGPLGATLIVFAATIATILLLALTARRHMRTALRRIFRAESGE